MKTPEELNALKEEVETVSKKLHELTDEELAQVSGGGDVPPELVIEPPVCPNTERLYLSERPVLEPPVLEPPFNIKYSL